MCNISKKYSNLGKFVKKKKKRAKIVITFDLLQKFFLTVHYKKIFQKLQMVVQRQEGRTSNFIEANTSFSTLEQI